MRSQRIVYGNGHIRKSPRVATRGLYRAIAMVAAVAVPAAWLRATVAAEEPLRPDKVVLHPAAEPKPALKYRLLPDVLDRKPGNAAVVYGKVKAEANDYFTDKELWEKVENYAMQAPLADLRKERGKWRGLATQPFGPFTHLNRAARCQYCDWQYPIGEPDQDLYTILLPECQEMRRFVKLLGVRARLQIADGQFDDAIYTLQTGYAVSRHAAAGPFLVTGLVGITCSQIMSDQVLEFIQQPGAPNLYWALTSLPRPLVDVRPAIDVEMAALYLSYPDLRDPEHKAPPHDPQWQFLKDPELRDLDRRELTPQEWQELLEKTVYRILRLSDAYNNSDPHVSKELFRLAVLGDTMRLYPQAKEFLVARGRSAAEVEAMPVPKVVLLYTLGMYDELRDEEFKWFNLPYPEAAAGLETADQRLKDAHARRAEIIPLATTFLPAMKAINNARARHERTFAILRVLEALRLYGAAHGRLPDQLADITEVPIPLDPSTGKPFGYGRRGDTAWLEPPLPPGVSPQSSGARRYEITFVPKGK